jgi:hypothetical protein
MSLLVSLYAAILFFALVPGVLLSIPRKGSKYVIAAVHALVFGLIYHFTHKLVWRAGVSLEGFEAPDISAPKSDLKEESEEKEDKKEKHDKE